MSKILLALDCLEFQLVFIDEFSINDFTNKSYNWAKKGTDSIIPQKRHYK